jgi:hypothetical protein
LPGTPGGRWIDSWDREWVDQLTIDNIHATGNLVYIVSSELHQRSIDLARWKMWKNADGICTDHPAFLEMFMNGDLDISTDAWWLSMGMK